MNIQNIPYKGVDYTKENYDESFPLLGCLHDQRVHRPFSRFSFWAGHLVNGGKNKAFPPTPTSPASEIAKKKIGSAWLFSRGLRLKALDSTCPHR